MSIAKLCAFIILAAAAGPHDAHAQDCERRGTLIGNVTLTY